MGSGYSGLKSKEATASDSADDELNKVQAPGLSATKTEEAQPCGVKKRKKLVKSRLPQALVEEIMTRPVTPFPAIPDELLAGFSEECRAAFAMEKADADDLMALDADIIRQYQHNGYAEVEEEVTDNEEEKVEED